MNDLYEAVMILGRSVEDINNYGWLCGALGDKRDAPKCVNGVLTVSAAMSDHKPWEYIVPKYIYSLDVEPMREPLWLASVALLETVPPNCRTLVSRDMNSWADDDPENEKTVESARRNLAALAHPRNEQNMQLIGDLLASINDVEDEHGPVLTRESAAAWFEAAFDHLAAELPKPITIGLVS